MINSILVTGSKGQVGQELHILSERFPDFHFTWVDLEELDITDGQAVQDLFEQHPFRYCINCAAYTAVDRAEEEKSLAQKVNVDGPAHLAEACQQYGCHLIHLSTDYVYHNQGNTPIQEDAATMPQGVYAATKLEGDQAVLDKLPSATILRTSWVYSSFGHNFVKTMLRLGREREQLTIIFDQVGTPTYAHDLAYTILTIIQKASEKEISPLQLGGIYHYSNEGVGSWYDFAHAIFEKAQINCRVVPIRTAQYPTPAQRPPFSLLDKAKIKQAFGIEIPHWRDALDRCLKAIDQ
ncbi:MAG: dTDP-4-dehydrorhamnose reductase [Bacteroidota bacterium]